MRPTTRAALVITGLSAIVAGLLLLAAAPCGGTAAHDRECCMAKGENARCLPCRPTRPA